LTRHLSSPSSGTLHSTGKPPTHHSLGDNQLTKSASSSN
jgi:hypothetical protein